MESGNWYEIVRLMLHNESTEKHQKYTRYRKLGSVQKRVAIEALIMTLQRRARRNNTRSSDKPYPDNSTSPIPRRTIQRCQFSAIQIPRETNTASDKYRAAQIARRQIARRTIPRLCFYSVVRKSAYLHFDLSMEHELKPRLHWDTQVS